jgi:two-component system, LytTR family, response regulator
MKITCVAIDDEPLALDIVKDYASKVPYLDFIRTFSNAIESIDFCKSNPVDLVFLDIQMEELTGVQWLKIINPRPLVIFTTAYDSFALQGYELDVVDYLLKPISFERFLKAVDKVYEKLRVEKMIQHPPIEVPAMSSQDDYFFVKTEFRLEKVGFDEILYIEGMGDYLRIVTPNKRIMTLQNFKKMEEILSPQRFCRVHKSYIVAMDKIESIERNRIRMAGQLIPVSDSYRKVFFSMLERKKLE